MLLLLVRNVGLLQVYDERRSPTWNAYCNNKADVSTTVDILHKLFTRNLKNVVRTVVVDRFKTVLL